MLKKLDREEKNAFEIRPEFKEGKRALLSSDKNGIHFPSLDFLDTSADNVSEDMILDYLAQIISDIYLKEVHGITTTTTEESSHLLPGINERTS